MKILPGISITLFFAVTVFGQHDTGFSPTQESSNSVIDELLTLESQEAAAMQAPAHDDLMVPMYDTRLIPTASWQDGCGCQQMSHYTLQPFVIQPYSNQVFSGNSFTTAPMQQYRSYQMFRMPQPDMNTNRMRQTGNTWPSASGAQYYYPSQPQFAPLRRGLLFNRFRR